MKESLFLFLCAILFFTTEISSQVSQEWVARYNGSGNVFDAAGCVVTDNSGNVYVTGNSTGSTTYMDYTTIKYNASGNQLWAVRYNGTGDSNDYAKSMVLDNSRNVYVTGSSSGAGNGMDILTVKYDTNGVLQWERRYNGPANGNDDGVVMCIDASDNLYVAGSSPGIGTNFDYVIIKYNSAGDIIWEQRFNGSASSSDKVTNMFVDIQGNVYLTGSGVAAGRPASDYLTVKYNAGGFFQWAAYCPGANTGLPATASSLALDDGGNVYVTGTNIYTPDKSVIPTVKYNSDGIQQWVTVIYGYDWNSICRGDCIKYDNSGYIYVAGKGSLNANVGGYLLVKYSTQGVQQWGQVIPNTNEAYSLTIDNAHNLYLAGRTNHLDENYAIAKFDVTGSLKWLQIYNGAGGVSDIAFSITTDLNYNVYVTGMSTGIGTGYDYATIKYSQLTGVNPVSNEIPKSFSLFQNYPNPFNPSTKIKFDIPAGSESNSANVKLRVFDALGREVAVLVDEQLHSGSYEVNWNSSDQPSGVYFYTLTAGDFKETKRMVLLK